MEREAMLAELKKKYAITQDQFEDMYQVVKRLVIGDKKRAKGKPTAVLVGGQPGSGKTEIVVETCKEFEQKGEDYVVLDVDTYRNCFPYTKEVLSEYPSYFSEITDPIVTGIMEVLIKETATEGYNIIYEGTMGNQKTHKAIQSIRENNCDVDIIGRVMATGKIESTLSLFERYILLKQKMGIGRFTTTTLHDTRYNKLLKVVEDLESNVGIPFEVYRRGKVMGYPIKIYASRAPVKTYQNAVEAITQGRAMSQKECTDDDEILRQRLNFITEALKAEPDLQYEVSILKERVNPFLEKQQVIGD